MADTIVESLRVGLDRFPATERRVAHHLLADYPMAGLQSATDLARQVSVSTPTVLRLVARLGFGSYPSFQQGLRQELAAQLSSPLNKPVVVARDRSETTQAEDFGRAVLANVRETFEHLPDAEFRAAAQLLLDPKLRIHLIGGRFSDALARYLSVQLRILRPGVVHLQDQESNWRDQLLDLGARDVLVIFDVRRYQPSLRRLAEGAAARRVRIVLLTDQWLSPIARVADRMLSARVEVPSVWDSSVALMALAEALLAAVAAGGWERSRRRMLELEQMREAQDREPAPAEAVSPPVEGVRPRRTLRRTS